MTFVFLQNHALHRDFDFLFFDAQQRATNIGFCFFELFFRSRLIWYWILISPGNGKHQCTTASHGHKEKGQRSFSSFGVITVHRIWYKWKKRFLPLHLISPGIFTLPIFWLPDIYLQGLYHHILFYLCNAIPPCPLWELGQASTGHTDFRWLTLNIFRAQNAPIPGFLIIRF